MKAGASGFALIFENWQASFLASGAVYATEHVLYTDAKITGGQLRFGPYELHNTIAHASAPINQSRIAPQMVLRYEHHLEHGIPDMSKTDVSRYHGGDLVDEVAALVALALGIRVRAGAVVREFTPDGDPKGKPVAYFGYGEPLLLKGVRGPILPNAAGFRPLQELSPYTVAPVIDPLDSVALVRAARLYQQAVWMAESDAALAWLLLVSALEAAADRYAKGTVSAIDRLRDARPELFAAIGSKCPDLLDVLADELANVVGARRKFSDLVLRSLPPPPDSRPPEWAQFSWKRQNVRSALMRIYDYRSKALHTGVPFPAPMCSPPERFQDWAAHAEKPLGLATSQQSGVWITEEIPMLLHTFEYIARSVLLQWWSSLLQKDSGVGKC